MNTSSNEIAIYSKGEVNGLLTRLSSRDKECCLSFFIKKFEGSEFGNNFLDKVNTELKKQDHVEVTLYFFLKKTLHLLQFFVDVAPESLDFTMMEEAEKLNNEDCSQLFKIFRKIKTKNFSFEINLENVTESFVKLFSEEIQNLSTNLKLFSVKINDKVSIFTKGLQHRAVLDKLTNFTSFEVKLRNFLCPNNFGYKLLYLTFEDMAISLSISDIDLGLLLIMKNTSENLQIRFSAAKKINMLLPLFIASSSTKQIELVRPTEKITRLELKVILKFYQFFNYTNSRPNLPLDTEEIKFLMGCNLFYPYKYLI